MIVTFAALCCALLCFYLLCFASLCFALLCVALLCVSFPCCALPCFALLCFAVLCFVLPTSAMHSCLLLWLSAFDLYFSNLPSIRCFVLFVFFLMSFCFQSLVSCVCFCWFRRLICLFHLPLRVEFWIACIVFCCWLCIFCFSLCGDSNQGSGQDLLTDRTLGRAKLSSGGCLFFHLEK